MSDEDYLRAVTHCQSIVSEKKMLVMDERERKIFDRAWEDMEKLRINYVERPKSMKPIITKGPNNGRDG